jgi:predicted nucleotidyltransferase component of viral defense system
MISESELRRIAARAGIGVGQAEQEYALLCVLDALNQTSPLSDTFCLKGGTALRLVYFDAWRHSIDLDFSVLPAFPADELRRHVEVWFAQVGRVHGLEMHLLDFHRANGAARMRARFVGPLRHPARLLFDITLDEPVLLPPERRRVIGSPFSDLQPSVLTYALEEILAEKLRSILQRGKSRDYYDVWRLLKEKAAAFDVTLARSILVQKCCHKGLNEPNTRAFLLPEQLAEAGVYWERDLAGQVAPRLLPGWAVVTSELSGLLEDFFSDREK